MAMPQLQQESLDFRSSRQVFEERRERKKKERKKEGRKEGRQTDRQKYNMPNT